MRLFIGIELDDAVRAAAARASETLRRRLARTVRALEARWVLAENLHVTVWFIGEVDDERAAAVRAALQAPLATPSFTLSLSGFGAFPPSGPPRVFWVGLRAGAKAAVGIYGEIAQRMTALGFEAERRGYTPHVTIARVKDAPRGRSRAIRETLAATAVRPGSCRIEAVTLFRSRLSPRGASYEPLLRVPLA